MSEDFGTRFAAIRVAGHDGWEEAFLNALEVADNWRHIRTLCVYAKNIRPFLKVDEALLAKTTEIDGEDFGNMKDSLIRTSEFLSGIIVRLDPNTKTAQWAVKEREKLAGTSSKKTTLSRARGA